ncbi:periplasmic binding protein-like I [Blastocladiella britannica]|nr:periplasmic binding protein-like I [Blastocladiella britannica]
MEYSRALTLRSACITTATTTTGQKWAFPRIMLGPITLALLSLLALCVAPASGTTTTFKISINLPILNTEFGTSATGVVDFINLLAPDLNSLDPTGQTQFQVIATATNATAFNTTLAMEPLLADPTVVGVVGEWDSSLTIPMTLAGSRAYMWSCSGMATSHTLSDKAQFPYFFRTIPEDPQQGQALAWFARHMGWATAAVIASADSYGQSVMSSFVNTASTIGITIMANQVFQPGQPDFTVILNAVKDSGTQIIMLCSLVDDSHVLMRQAREANMIGPNWVWLAPDGFSDWANQAANATELAQVNGLMYMFPRENSFTTMYNASVARWNAAYPTASIPPYTFLMQDCVTALARGVIGLVNTVGATNVLARTYYPDLSRYFLNSFEGLTGTIRYDEVGNRLGYFSVYNWYNGTATVAYEVNPDLSITSKAPPKFFSGTSVVPPDVPVRAALIATWTSPSGVALAAMNALFISIVVATTMVLAQNREVPAVKSMSFTFLCVIALGLVMVLVSNLVGLGVQTTATCVVDLWLFSIGALLVLAASLVKAYRIWRIFDNASMTRMQIKNKTLMLGMSLLLGIQLILLVVWTVVSPPTAMTVTSHDWYYQDCASANAGFGTGMTAATLLYNSGLLGVLLYLAYKTRNIASNFRESAHLAYVAQNTLLAGIVVAMFEFFSFGSSTLTAFIVRQVVIMYVVMFAYSALLGRIAVAAHFALRKSASSQSNTNVVAISTMGSRAGGGASSTGGGAVGMGSAGRPLKPSEPMTISVLRGTFPVKKNGMLSTWHRHVLMLMGSESLLAITPIHHADQSAAATVKPGVLAPLSHLIISTSPTTADLEHCLEIVVKGVGVYLVQFKSADELQMWADAISARDSQQRQSAAAPSVAVGGAALGANILKSAPVTRGKVNSRA